MTPTLFLDGIAGTERSWRRDIYARRLMSGNGKKLKAAALKKARAQGLTLSAMLNLATRAYVDNEIEIDVLARDLAEARKGKTIPAGEVYRRLGVSKGGGHQPK